MYLKDGLSNYDTESSLSEVPRGFRLVGRALWSDASSGEDDSEEKQGHQSAEESNKSATSSNDSLSRDINELPFSPCFSPCGSGDNDDPETIEIIKEIPLITLDD